MHMIYAHYDITSLLVGEHYYARNNAMLYNKFILQSSFNILYFTQILHPILKSDIGEKYSYNIYFKYSNSIFKNDSDSYQSNTW